MQNQSVSEDLEDAMPTDIPIVELSPPPTTPEALHAITTLTKYFEALPVSSLQHPTTMRNTFEVSDIVSSLRPLRALSKATN